MTAWLGKALCALLFWSDSAQLRQPERLAPYVPSPQPVVERMLEAANLKPGETVYDLGCDDGRILLTAAEKFSCS